MFIWIDHLRVKEQTKNTSDLLNTRLQQRFPQELLCIWLPCVRALQIFVPRWGDETVPEDHAPGSEQDARRRDQGRRRQGCPTKEVWDEGELSQVDSLQRCVCVFVYLFFSLNQTKEGFNFSSSNSSSSRRHLSANVLKIPTFYAPQTHLESWPTSEWLTRRQRRPVCESYRGRFLDRCGFRRWD